MIRKLILPAIAVLLLAGCATGYTYRSAPGDYYHGQPGVVYRDYYGYPGYYSPYGWGGYYGGGYYDGGYYGYRRGYYNYPGRYYGYPQRPRPDDGGDHVGDRTPDRSTPPWRDLRGIAERRDPGTSEARPRSRPAGQRPRAQQPTPTQQPAPIRRIEAPVSTGGSRMSELIRKTRSN